MRLCGFADEADSFLSGQVTALKRNKMELLEIRGVDEENISVVSVGKLKEIKKMLDENGIGVWSIGSPIGKADPCVDFDSHIADGEMSGVKVCAAGHYPSQGTSVSGSFLRRRASRPRETFSSRHIATRNTEALTALSHLPSDTLQTESLIWTADRSRSGTALRAVRRQSISSIPQTPWTALTRQAPLYRPFLRL